MKRIRQTALLILVGALLVVLFGCGAASEEEVEDTLATVSLAPILTAYLKQVLPAEETTTDGTTTDGTTTDTSTLTNFLGTEHVLSDELMAVQIGSSVSQRLEWSVTINDETLDAVSELSTELLPGGYDISLLVNEGEQQYAGLAQQSILDGENTVEMTIRPIVGDHVEDVALVYILTTLNFELGDAVEDISSQSEPSIGVIIDDNPEEIFKLDPENGFTDSGNLEPIFANITPNEPHTIQINIYDGQDQIAQSEPQSEIIPDPSQVEEPVEVVIIVSATGTVGITVLNVDTGDATFKFVIPHVVVEEAGGASNLEVKLTVTGAAAPDGMQNIFPTVSLDPEGTGDYVTERSIAGFQYGRLDMMLTFTEISTGEKLGDCVYQNSILLDSLGSSDTCGLKLRRRAVISGKLKAVLAFNVFDVARAPVAGAIIIDVATGKRIGITGGCSDPQCDTNDSNFFGTPGYLTVFHNAGENMVFRAQSATHFGESSITLLPLELGNLDIIADQALSE